MVCVGPAGGDPGKERPPGQCVQNQRPGKPSLKALNVTPHPCSLQGAAAPLPAPRVSCPWAEVPPPRQTNRWLHAPHTHRHSKTQERHGSSHVCVKGNPGNTHRNTLASPGVSGSRAPYSLMEEGVAPRIKPQSHRFICRGRGTSAQGRGEPLGPGLPGPEGAMHNHTGLQGGSW